MFGINLALRAFSWLPKRAKLLMKFSYYESGQEAQVSHVELDDGYTLMIRRGCSASEVKDGLHDQP